MTTNKKKDQNISISNILKNIPNGSLAAIFIIFIFFRASGKVDISSDEIYNMGTPLVEYGDFLYSVKIILGIILQLTIADRSSFLVCENAQKTKMNKLC